MKNLSRYLLGRSRSLARPTATLEYTELTRKDVAKLALKGTLRVSKNILRKIQGQQLKGNIVSELFTLHYGGSSLAVLSTLGNLSRSEDSQTSR